MKQITLILFILSSLSSFSQNPNYAEDVADILYQNCTSCHHTGGIAPFPLMTYSEANSWGPQIVLETITGNMPPWPVDSTYQRYSHERILSLADITTLIDWNNNGRLQGDPTLTPTAPTYIAGATIPNPDYTLALPQYTSNATTEDDYVCFSVQTSFASDMFIKAIEVLPGNPAIVHHALVFIDTSAIGAPITTDCMGVDGKLVAGYTPGSNPAIFPNGGNIKMGVRLPAGANIVVQMHYPEGSAGMIDSTKVNFFFYPTGTTGVREVYTDPILKNWNLWIPPNTTPTFNASYPANNGVLPYDFSILSVFPHMHLLGEEITSYAVTGTNDTIPFERIKHWDFEWQGFYNFRNILKVPAGSRMYGTAKFDNTSGNPHNPNNPPVLVTAGESTTDEMFLIYFQYLLYQQGDENLNIDSLLNVSTAINETQFLPLEIYPNPSKDYITIQNAFESDFDITILDILGKIVKKGTGVNSKQMISIATLKAGKYICYITSEGNIYSTKFIKN